MEVDDDDPVIDEIPIYLSKNLTDLHVVQFPIKNHLYNIDKSKIVNSCIKPQSKQIKIDFEIDTASRNYDAFKGEMLARTTDGHKSSADKNEHPSFSSGRMDKVSFSSSISVENERYALGVMQDRELHLVPISTFFQMRQTYSYFDKGDNRKNSEKGDMEADDEATEVDLKQVTVKFARTGDTEKIKKAREKSYHFISQIGKDEPWCETFIYPKHSPESAIERQRIPHITNASDEHIKFINIPPTEYFGNLVDTEAHSLDIAVAQIPTDDKEIKIETIRGPISQRKIKKFQLLDQLKLILRDGKLLSFNHLMEIVGNSSISADKVLRNLTLCGIMIRGNWTLQSEVLYSPNFVSLRNGIKNELMCRGRDYILFKLMRNEMMTLNRQKISAITQLPPEETLEILESVASLKSNKIWDLLKSPDYDFEKRHPEIFQRQEALWKAQEEKFVEMEAEKTEKRKRTRSVRESKP